MCVFNLKLKIKIQLTYTTKALELKQILDTLNPQYTVREFKMAGDYPLNEIAFHLFLLFLSNFN
jgi:hypothetical protein